MTTPNPPGDRRVPDLAASLIRTWSPIVAGAVLTFAATRWRLVLPPDLSAGAGALIAGALAGGWYALARWLERRQGGSWFAVLARPAGRWMLGGVISQPVYAAVGEVVQVIAHGRDERLR